MCETRNHSLSLWRKPQGHAVLCMTLSMTLHFFGYEFSRAAVTSLFTSSSTGFASPNAYSIAMTCASPFSFLLLLWYGRELERHGPHLALRNSTILCATIMSAATIMIHNLNVEVMNKVLFGAITPAKIIVGFVFLFQNSYIQLLYQQHWSFLGSVLDSNQGAKYFASIAGVSSLASTIAASLVSKFVNTIGLSGLLLGASASLITTIPLSNRAYVISAKYGFDPSDELNKNKGKKSDLDTSWKGTLVKARTLFQDVPILGKLFVEVISFQTLMAIINLCFITRLKHEITDDSQRAAYTGQLYALVNGLSAFFQFVFLPFVLQKVSLVWILRVMPVLPIICIFATCCQREPTLAIIAFTLLSTKTMEYSTRNVVNEMIYVELDFNSRYLGKEIVGAFGTKLGKSMISLLLSLLPYCFGEIPEFTLIIMAAVAAIQWFISAVTLSSLTPPQMIKKKNS